MSWKRLVGMFVFLSIMNVAVDMIFGRPVRDTFMWEGGLITAFTVFAIDKAIG